MKILLASSISCVLTIVFSLTIAVVIWLIISNGEVAKSEYETKPEHNKVVKNEWREPQQGDIRIRSGFLLKPKTINGVTKFLCFASWEEEYTFFGSALTGDGEYWSGKRWIS